MVGSGTGVVGGGDGDGTSEGVGRGMITGPSGPVGPGPMGPPGPGGTATSVGIAGYCRVESRSPARPVPVPVPSATSASHRRRNGAVGRASGSLVSSASSSGPNAPALVGGRGGSRTIAIMVGTAVPLS